MHRYHSCACSYIYQGLKGCCSVAAVLCAVHLHGACTVGVAAALLSPSLIGAVAADLVRSSPTFYDGNA